MGKTILILWTIVLSTVLLNCDASTINDSVTTSSVGSVTGKVYDASTGAVISGATVYIIGYSSTTITRSSSDGTYTITSSPTGNQTVEGDQTGYISDTKAATVTSGATVSNINLFLIPTAFTSNKYVVVLSWGATPTDLDAHLKVPTDVGNGCSVNAVDFNDRGSITVDPFAFLDVDAQSGFGPETITIKQSAGAALCTGTYRYYVHNFSNDAGASLNASAGLVKLYNGSTLIKTYSIPTTGTSTHRYWWVFDLSGSTITDVNTTQAAAP